MFDFFKKKKLMTCQFVELNVIKFVEFLTLDIQHIS